MSEKQGAKRMGRPPKFAGERTRGPLTVRLRDSVREDLEAAAKQSGRSLSEEIEYRLEIALERRDFLVEQWGQDVFNIAESLARSLWHIERHFGARWVEDDRVFDVFRLSAVALIENYRDIIRVNRRDERKANLDDSTPEDLARIFAALGGITPPRPRAGGKPDSEGERALRHAEMERWKTVLDGRNSRPLPIANSSEQRWRQEWSTLERQLAAEPDIAKRAAKWEAALESMVTKMGMDRNWFEEFRAAIRHMPSDPLATDFSPAADEAWEDRKKALQAEGIIDGVGNSPWKGGEPDWRFMGLNKDGSVDESEKRLFKKSPPDDAIKAAANADPAKGDLAPKKKGRRA